MRDVVGLVVGFLVWAKDLLPMNVGFGSAESGALLCAAFYALGRVDLIASLRRRLEPVPVEIKKPRAPRAKSASRGKSDV
jgi:hypothetical protein